MRAVDSAEAAIKGSERRVTGFPGNLHHEAVGEPDDRMLPELLDGGGDGLGVLDRPVLVMQEHLDSCRDCFRTTVVD